MFEINVLKRKVLKIILSMAASMRGATAKRKKSNAVTRLLNCIHKSYVSTIIHMDSDVISSKENWLRLFVQDVSAEIAETEKSTPHPRSHEHLKFARSQEFRMLL